MGEYLSKEHTVLHPVVFRLCGNTCGEKDTGEIACVDQWGHHSNFYFLYSYLFL